MDDDEKPNRPGMQAALIDPNEKAANDDTEVVFVGSYRHAVTGRQISPKNATAFRPVIRASFESRDGETSKSK